MIAVTTEQPVGTFDGNDANAILKLPNGDAFYLVVSEEGYYHLNFQGADWDEAETLIDGFIGVPT